MTESGAKEQKKETMMKARMQHTKETIQRLSSVQYNTYCQGQRLTALVFSLVMLFLGASGNFGQTTSLVLVFIGCWAFTGMNVPADRNAKKIIEMAKGDFPASEYFFEENGIRILGDGQENKLDYSAVYSLICDGPYLYLFLNPSSAYMVALKDMDNTQQEQLKSLLCEKTGLLLERPGSLKTLSLSTLLKMKKKK